jgi:hypothetical protein
MRQENQANKPVPQELSQPEVALSELNIRIWEAYGYLMTTFFQKDTWNVRQGGAYGFALLEVKGDGKDHDWEKEKRVVRSIASDLGDRLGYYEAAYHFPDVLSALGHMTHTSWVEMIAERDLNKPKSKVAEEILEQMRENLLEEAVGFEKFLNSGDFRNAFSIQVDKKTGEYQINDLPLDANELRAKWESWFGTNTNSLTSSRFRPHDLNAKIF